MGRDSCRYTGLVQAQCTLACNISRYGAAASSLGSLCQGLTTLLGRNLFLISHLILPSVSENPFRSFCHSNPCPKSLSSSLGAPVDMGRGCKVSPEVPFLQLEHPQLSQSISIAEMLQPCESHTDMCLNVGYKHMCLHIP